LLSVLLWIVLLFAALAGLDRSFVKEEESHTAPLLRLSASPLVVWAGKLAYNLVLLYLLMALLVPLFALLMGFEVVLVGWFVLLLTVGGYALAVTATIVAAIISRAMTRGALYSVLSLPLLLPLVIFLIQGTAAVSDGSLDTVQSSVRAVVSLGGVMTVVSAFVFPVVWND
jgi:heme exporter protein B